MKRARPALGVRTRIVSCYLAYVTPRWQKARMRATARPFKTMGRHMPILNRAAEMQDEIAGWRRHIHRTPELGFDVYQTADFVAAQAQGVRLRRGGRRASPGPASSASSRAGSVRGRRSACAPTWTRCRSTRPRASPTRPPFRGKMHACGHDGHTAMLLGAAKYLAETQQLRGLRGGHLPAGRRRRRRRQRDGQGRHDGALRHRARVRHAQHAGPAGRAVRDQAGRRSWRRPPSSPSG